MCSKCSCHAYIGIYMFFLLLIFFDFYFLRSTNAKAKKMLKRTTALGVSRLLGASLGASTWRPPHALFAPNQLHHRHISKGRRWKDQILQKTAFSHWSRKGLHQDHLVVCWSPCQKWPNIQENGCYCPPIGHIQDHIRWGRGMNSPISLLHS